MNRDIPNFDTLLQIAQSDPNELEQIRERLAASTISAAPKALRPRLRGLQFRIDSTRQLAKTPLSACIQLSEMMYQSFEELREALNKPAAPKPETGEKSSADVIPFPCS